MRRVASVLALCAALLAAAGASADIRDEFIRIGESVATKVAVDPADFLYDIHLASEDRTPLPIDKDWQIGTNIFPGIIPFTEVSLGVKSKVKGEHGGWPQIDLNAGGWDSIASSVVGNYVEDFKGNLWGLRAGVSGSVSLDPRLRLFAGYEFSQMRVDVNIKFKDMNTKTGLELRVLQALSNLHVGKTEHFVFTGAEVLRTARKRIVAEVGYGVVHNKLLARLTWASRSFDTGFAFYPEGAWVLWPIWNFQVRF
jgi:hypothetical protein